jgi:hypothetical protein
MLKVPVPFIPEVEKDRLALQSLRGTKKALSQRGWDQASPQLAAAAGISPEAANSLWISSIMNLPFP